MTVRCLNKEKDEKSATESNHDAIGQREGGAWPKRDWER